MENIQLHNSLSHWNTCNYFMLNLLSSWLLWVVVITSLVVLGLFNPSLASAWLIAELQSGLRTNCWDNFPLKGSRLVQYSRPYVLTMSVPSIWSMNLFVSQLSSKHMFAYKYRFLSRRFISLRSDYRGIHCYSPTLYFLLRHLIWSDHLFLLSMMMMGSTHSLQYW